MISQMCSVVEKAQQSSCRKNRTLIETRHLFMSRWDEEAKITSCLENSSTTSLKSRESLERVAKRATSLTESSQSLTDQPCKTEGSPTWKTPSRDTDLWNTDGQTRRKSQTRKRNSLPTTNSTRNSSHRDRMIDIQSSHLIR